MNNVAAHPTINGIVETALYVTDLPRALGFYRDVLGLRQLFEEPGRLIVLRAGDRQVLLLFAQGQSKAGAPAPQGGFIPPHDGVPGAHVAFAIAADEVNAWSARLKESHIEVESVVRGPGGGVSLYFRDPDQHLVELLTPGFWPIY